MKTAVIIAGIFCALCYGYLLVMFVQFILHDYKRKVNPITKSDLFDEESMKKYFKDIQDLIEKKQPKKLTTMKTKTIDKLSEHARLITKSHIADFADINNANAILLLLEKEKQRKEHNKLHSYKDHSFAYANGIALGIDPNYTIEQKKEIMNRARNNSVIMDDYQRGYRDSNFQHGISQFMLSDLCKKLRKENEGLKSQNKDLLYQLEHNKVTKQPKPSIVDCISTMIQQVKNSDYKPNVIQFIEDGMIIEMQITDNKVTLKRKN